MGLDVGPNPRTSQTRTYPAVPSVPAVSTTPSDLLRNEMLPSLGCSSS